MRTDEEFDRLAKTYMDTVFRLALNYVKSPSEADDVTQNVLLKLYRCDKAFESEAHLKHWLLRVAINECKKALLSPWQRDAETARKAEIAQAAVADFTGAALDEQRAETPPADAAPVPEPTPAAAEGWAQYVLDDGGGLNIAMADYAAEDRDGILSYYFSPNPAGEDGGSIWVRVAPDGRIVSLDCRQASPYPVPEDAPEQYFAETCDIIDGAFVPNGKYAFLTDLYLTEVAYPDKEAYRGRAEQAAVSALDFLHQNGLIAECGADADITYFNLFNGGAAWVDVLMTSGSVYGLMLQPEDLSVLGFMYCAPEDTARTHDYRRLFEALRTDTLDEYQAQLQEEFKNGLG